jgi:hypothetical protein
MGLSGLATTYGAGLSKSWDSPVRVTYKTPEMGQEALGGLSSLIANYNTAYGEAKRMNESRYQQMLDIIDQTTGQRAADIRSSYGNQRASTMQNLSRLGMANTTVAPTMQMGYQREQESALNRLADDMQGTKLGVIERRTDAYPDQSMLLNLMQQIGSSYGTSGLSSALRQFGNMRM